MKGEWGALSLLKLGVDYFGPFLHLSTSNPLQKRDAEHPQARLQGSPFLPATKALPLQRLAVYGGESGVKGAHIEQEV